MTAKHATITEALVAAQAEMPKVPKKGRNPHYKSEFVTLDDLLDAARPVLNRHGLALVQMPTELGDDHHPGLLTSIRHESGEQVWSTMPLIVAKQDMQGLGAAITYARRYMLAAALGIAEGTDDDGNQAAGVADNSRSRPERRVEGPEAYPVPKTWARVREAVGACDNREEAWKLFEAFVRACSYHLYGETNSKKLSNEQSKVMLQKAAGAAVWLQDIQNVPYDGSFRYFGKPEQTRAWASVLDGHILEIPDYKPPTDEPPEDRDLEALAARAQEAQMEASR